MIKIGTSSIPDNITPENFRMPFGKYKGHPVTMVPTETILYYLGWDKLDAMSRAMLEQELDKTVRQREIAALEELADEDDEDWMWAQSNGEL